MFKNYKDREQKKLINAKNLYELFLQNVKFMIQKM